MQTTELHLVVSIQRYLRGKFSLVQTFVELPSLSTHARFILASISLHFEQREREREEQRRLTHAFCMHRSTALRYGGKLTMPHPCSQSRCSKVSEIDASETCVRARGDSQREIFWVDKLHNSANVCTSENFPCCFRPQVPLNAYDQM